MSVSMLLKASVPVILLLLSEKCSEAAQLNCVLQLVLFSLTSHLPCLLTSRMSYVDISWPWGLVTIGLCPLLTGVTLVGGEFDFLCPGETLFCPLMREMYPVSPTLVSCGLFLLTGDVGTPLQHRVSTQCINQTISF